MDGRFTAITDAGAISGHTRGVGLDLLVLHGGPGLSDYTEMVRDEIKAWRAIHYQQRGLEPSPTRRPYTIARHVADAAAVLDHLGVSRTVVFGHSWGANLALHLALAEPRRVTGLVLVEGLGATGDGGDSAMAAELVRRLFSGGQEHRAAVERQLERRDVSDQEALTALRLLWPGYFARPEMAPEPPSDLRLSVRCNVESKASLLESMEGGKLAERLRALAIPAVVMVGERSPLPPTAGAELANLLPQAELLTVPEAGHLPWHEQPGSLSRALAHIADLARV